MCPRKAASGSGHGAAREVCDTLLRAQHKYEALLAAACSGETRGLVG